MKKYILVALLLVVYSCKKKEVAQKINFVKLEEQLKQAIPEKNPLGKMGFPYIISLNSEYLEYFDKNENKIFKVDLKTNKKTLLHIPKGGGYLSYYKQTKDYTAVSNGWETSTNSKIKVGNEKEIVFPNYVISDCLNEKIILSFNGEGLFNDDGSKIKFLTQVYNVETKKLHPLKTEIAASFFMDENTLLTIKRFRDKDSYELIKHKELIIYNLLDDSYQVIISPFDIDAILKYSKKGNFLYYIDNYAVYRLSLESKKIELVYKGEITLPHIIGNSMLVGYIYDKENKTYNLTFIPIENKSLVDMDIGK